LLIILFLLYVFVLDIWLFFVIIHSDYSIFLYYTGVFL